MYITSDSLQRWFHIFVPKRLEVDLTRITATGSDEKPFINSVDVTKLLAQNKGFHDKRYALGIIRSAIYWDFLSVHLEQDECTTISCLHEKLINTQYLQWLILALTVYVAMHTIASTQTMQISTLLYLCFMLTSRFSLTSSTNSKSAKNKQNLFYKHFLLL